MRRWRKKEDNVLKGREHNGKRFEHPVTSGGEIKAPLKALLVVGGRLPLTACGRRLVKHSRAKI